MTELLTAARMRAIEAAAMEDGHVTGLALMERAGQGALDAIMDARPDAAARPGRAAVLCGPGNNGGDGFVIARLLLERGWSVELLLYGKSPDEIDALPADAAASAKRWRGAGGSIDPLTRERLAAGLAWVREAGEGAPRLFVDALFGTGLTRPLPEDLREASREWGVDEWRDAVAIDVPSGVCADSGRVVGGVHFPSRLCVTFHCPKRGHYLGHWSHDCHRLAVVDIGLDDVPEREGECYPVRLASPLVGPRHSKWGLWKESDEHKHWHGSLLVLAGGPGHGGAARLAARAALRVGAGLVTVGCPSEAMIENAARLDAVMVRAIDGAGGFRDWDGHGAITAYAMGFGFGRGAACRETVAAVLRADKPAVLDADALTSFEDNPSELFGALHRRVVLTPHPGEFRRLFPDIAVRLDGTPETGPAYSKIDATRDAAARAGCAVLLKGADTVIAGPEGRTAVSGAAYERAAPWLATAGSGDVLAGLIAGLLARGFEPFDAAATAAWLHVEAAVRFGPGLIAEDLPDALPGVLRDLGL
ncbi:MAG: NAD(P)H-hydrate dehydratase [Paracoccaceae bacterium]